MERKVFNSKFSNLKKENPIEVKLGHNNGPLQDPSNTFTYNRALCESVYQPDKQINAYIVFGRDRDSDWKSGYGGRGYPKAAAMDIVVGRGSSIDARTLPKGSLLNPSVGADAARIYLSQKADIDDYYFIAPGKTENLSIGKSAIAIKADDVRLIARNTLKIVTGTDYICSDAIPPESLMGIQLIANNDDSDLQPIPKGNNLVSALDNIIDEIAKLNGLVRGFMEIQKEFNSHVANHTHKSPFKGKNCSKSPSLLKNAPKLSLKMYNIVDQGLKFHKNNLVSTKNNFVIGSKPINSSFNYTN